MRVLLTSEARFERTPDGAVWGPPAYGRGLWTRYLEVFAGVTIAARVTDVAVASGGCVQASLPDVQFCPLIAYSGLSGLLENLVRTQRQCRGRRARIVRDHRQGAVADRLSDGACGCPRASPFCRGSRW